MLEQMVHVSVLRLSERLLCMYLNISDGNLGAQKASITTTIPGGAETKMDILPR